MLVTGRSLIVLGMVTDRGGPVYPVMVIVPLLVVKVNWACTVAAGRQDQQRQQQHARC